MWRPTHITWMQSYLVWVDPPHNEIKYNTCVWDKPKKKWTVTSDGVGTTDVLFVPLANQYCQAAILFQWLVTWHLQLMWLAQQNLLPDIMALSGYVNVFYIVDKNILLYFIADKKQSILQIAYWTLSFATLSCPLLDPTKCQHKSTFLC